MVNKTEEIILPPRRKDMEDPDLPVLGQFQYLKPLWASLDGLAAWGTAWGAAYSEAYRHSILSKGGIN